MGTLILFVHGALTPWTGNTCPFAIDAGKNLVGIPLYLQEILGYDTKERLVIVPMQKHPLPDSGWGCLYFTPCKIVGLLDDLIN